MMAWQGKRLEEKREQGSLNKIEDKTFAFGLPLRSTLCLLTV